MSKKIGVICKGFLFTFLTIVLLLSLAGLSLVITSAINKSDDVFSYVYALLAEFVMTITNAFNVSNYSVVAGVISGVLIVLIICTIVFVSKMFKKGKSGTAKTMSIIFTSVLCVIFTTLAILFSVNASAIETEINLLSNSFIQEMTNSMGANFCMVKGYVLLYSLSIVSLMSVVTFSICFTTKKESIGETSDSNIVYFYSSDYEPQEESIKIKDTNEKKTEVGAIPEKNPRAKQLIYKIMELENLKKEGKITQLEYTKLKQKAIKRYKD